MTKPGLTLRAAARERYRAAARDDAVLNQPLPPLTPLTREVRRLYEAGVVPVREIARLAGVTERTIYKYAQKLGWRPRVKRLARGAGGRFVPRAEEGKRHARGLKAVDASATAASVRCAHAGALSAKAVEAAEAARADRARFDTIVALNRVLGTLCEIQDGADGRDSEAAKAVGGAANTLIDQWTALQAVRRR